MKKIESLTELRIHLQKGVGEGHRNTIESCSSNGEILTGWSELRTVIVGSLLRGIRCCARAEKAEDETEIIVIRKPPVDVKMKLKSRIGLTQKEWDKIIPRCAAWLEKKGLYIDRECITNITPMFCNMQS